MAWWSNIGVPAINCRIVTVTPAIAKDWIDSRNVKNRHPKAGNIARIRRAIESRQWCVNGETIIFSRSGNLIDGQHRLMAIIEASIAVTCYVVFDIEEETFTTVDTGRVRQACDVVSIGGFENSTTVSAAAKLLYFHLRGKTGVSNSAQAPSNESLLALCQQYEGLHVSAKAIQKMKNVIAPSVAAFSHFITSLNGSDLHCEFWEKIHTGENLLKGNAAYALRERLMNNRKIGVKSDVYETIAYIFKCFNAYIKNQEVKGLRFQNGDVFPKIHGDNLFASIQE